MVYREGHVVMFGLPEFESITELNCGDLSFVDMLKLSGKFF